MKQIFKKYWLLIISLGVLCCVSLIVYVTGAVDCIPRLRVAAKSPDGSLTVMVYQKRLALRPVFPRMGAIAKIYDLNGKLIFEKTIYSDDDWDDTLGDAYTQITFVGEQIRIGPNPYNQDLHYTINRSDLWNLPN